jgi:hypothetical protein
MCFSASGGIDSLAVNGLVLAVKNFTMPFDHFVLLLFHWSAQLVRDNTSNSENATKIYKELMSRASATGVHNLLGFEWLLPL